jgi:hypothetical protein
MRQGNQRGLRLSSRGAAQQAGVGQEVVGAQRCRRGHHLRAAAAGAALPLIRQRPATQTTLQQHRHASRAAAALPSRASPVQPQTPPPQQAAAKVVATRVRGVRQHQLRRMLRHVSHAGPAAVAAAPRRLLLLVVQQAWMAPLVAARRHRPAAPQLAAPANQQPAAPANQQPAAVGLVAAARASRLRRLPLLRLNLKRRSHWQPWLVTS